MKRLKTIHTNLLLSLIAITVISCSSNSKTEGRTDTLSSGVARIVVDECLAPILQEQVDVFEGVYPEATILPIYTSEKEAYDILMKDSVRVLIGTRKLSDAEISIIKDQKRQRLVSQRLAVDGVALIVNKSNTDTLITVDAIKKIMTGEIKNWKELDPNSKLGDITIIFDSPNSSTSRYINDSITNKLPFAKNVKSIAEDNTSSDNISNLTPNQQVISYVQQNENALGVVGVSWISNRMDTTGLSFSSKVNVMSIGTGEEVEGKALYYKPYPSYIGMKFYPLSRDVYIILTDSRGGLPSGFVNFAAGEKGQRIIFKSGLFPATIPTRVVSVRPMSEL